MQRLSGSPRPGNLNVSELLSGPRLCTSFLFHAGQLSPHDRYNQRQFRNGPSFLPPETGWAACALGQQAHTQNLGGRHYDEASRDLKIVGNDFSTLDQSTWGGGLRSSEDRTAFTRTAGRGSPGREVSESGRHGGQGFPNGESFLPPRGWPRGCPPELKSQGGEEGEDPRDCVSASASN